MSQHDHQRAGAILMTIRDRQQTLTLYRPVVKRDFWLDRAYYLSVGHRPDTIIRNAIRVPIPALMDAA